MTDVIDKDEYIEMWNDSLLGSEGVEKLMNTLIAERRDGTTYKMMANVYGQDISTALETDRIDHDKEGLYEAIQMIEWMHKAMDYLKEGNYRCMATCIRIAHDYEQETYILMEDERPYPSAMED